MKSIFNNITQNTDEWNALRLGRFMASMFSDLFIAKDKIGYKRAKDIFIQLEKKLNECIDEAKKLIEKYKK